MCVSSRVDTKEGIINPVNLEERRDGYYRSDSPSDSFESKSEFSEPIKDGKWHYRNRKCHMQHLGNVEVHVLKTLQMMV